MITRKIPVGRRMGSQYRISDRMYGRLTSFMKHTYEDRISYLVNVSGQSLFVHGSEHGRPKTHEVKRVKNPSRSTSTLRATSNNGENVTLPMSLMKSCVAQEVKLSEDSKQRCRRLQNTHQGESERLPCHTLGRACLNLLWHCVWHETRKDRIRMVAYWRLKTTAPIAAGAKQH